MLTQSPWLAGLLRILPGCFLVLLFSDLASAQESANHSLQKQATLFETLADIKVFSRRLDSAGNDVERVDAIVDLGQLYLRVVGDSRFAKSERLQGFRGRIGSKLRKAQKSIIRAIKKSESQSTGSQDRYETVGTAADAPVEGLESAVIDRHWRLLAHSVGATGPSMYYGSGLHGTSGHFYRGRAGGVPGDNGEDLVDLIETILHPDFWRVNGGPGMVYYYQPLRILVVRATTEVHEDLEHFLETLRGNSR